jgi:hypothetical protein
MSGHGPWFPPQDHRNPGRLCSAGARLPCRAPPSWLLCSPPTPCPHQPRLRFPWRWPPSMRALVLCPQADDTCARTVPCVGDGAPALRETGMGRGEARASPVTGPSSASVLWSNTPPDTTPSLPQKHLTQRAVVAFDELQHSRHPDSLEVSGPQSHGPPARMPTHRSTCFQARRQACYRLRRAHPWPGRIRTCWTMNEVSWWHRILQFPSTHRAWSH